MSAGASTRSRAESRVLHHIPFYQCWRKMFLLLGVVPLGTRLGVYWMIDVEEALEFALDNEGADAPRPPAMPLQEREEKVVLLAQRGLRFRDVQVRILEFVGLA